MDGWQGPGQGGDQRREQWDLDDTIGRVVEEESRVSEVMRELEASTPDFEKLKTLQRDEPGVPHLGDHF